MPRAAYVKRRKTVSRRKGRALAGTRSTGYTMGVRRPAAAAGASGGSIAWHGSPFPRSLRTQVTYADNYTQTITAGAPYNYLFSTGSLYDPNVTSTGNQPRFFDTLCGANGGSAPYTSYRVFGSTINIRVIATGSDSIACRGWVGIGLFDTSSTGPSTAAEMNARADFRTKYIGYWGSGHDMCEMTRSMRQKDLFDIKDIRDQQECGAVYNASPVLDGRWCVTIVPSDETASRTYQVFLKITYDCEFYKRNDVADS